MSQYGVARQDVIRMLHKYRVFMGMEDAQWKALLGAAGVDESEANGVEAEMKAQAEAEDAQADQAHAGASVPDVGASQPPASNGDDSADHLVNPPVTGADGVLELAIDDGEATDSEDEDDHDSQPEGGDNKASQDPHDDDEDFMDD